MTRNVWMAGGHFSELARRWNSLSQVCENFRENELVTSEWFSNNLRKIFSFALYAIPKAANVIFVKKLLSIQVTLKSKKKNQVIIFMSLFQVHGLWRDNANAEEGDETDEPPMSPASPPGTTICSEIKSQPKQSHIWPIRTPSQIMRPVPSAGKHATIAEPGKRCNQCQARETCKTWEGKRVNQVTICIPN